MILKERLEDMKPDEFVYIGSRSAFFFIGTVEEALKSADKVCAGYLENWVRIRKKHGVAIERAMSGEYKATLENRIRECKERITKAELKFVNEEFADRIGIKELGTIIKKEYESIKKYEQSIANIPFYLDREYGAMANSEEFIGNYKPPLEREIREEYARKAVEPLGTIILVDGDEEGKYWMYSEWLNKENVPVPDEHEDDEE